MMLPWQKALARLQPQFESHDSADLHIFYVRVDLTLNQWREQRNEDEEQGPLRLPPAECWRGERPSVGDVITEHHPSRPHEMMMLRRRVFFGRDEILLNHFLGLAQEAGNLIREISPNSVAGKNAAARWIDYVGGLAVREVQGVGLSAESVSVPLAHRGHDYFLISTNIFRASALAIAAILFHLAENGDANSPPPPYEKEAFPLIVDLCKNRVTYLGVVYDVEDDVAMFLDALKQFPIGETVSFPNMCKIHPDLEPGNRTRTKDKILDKFPGLLENNGKKGYRFICSQSP